MLTKFNPLVDSPRHLIPGGDKKLFEHIRHEAVVLCHHDFLHGGPAVLKASGGKCRHLHMRYRSLRWAPQPWSCGIQPGVPGRVSVRSRRCRDRPRQLPGLDGRACGRQRPRCSHGVIFVATGRRMEADQFTPCANQIAAVFYHAHFPNGRGSAMSLCRRHTVPGRSRRCNGFLKLYLGLMQGLL